jgi:hypothetical protein
MTGGYLMSDNMSKTAGCVVWVIFVIIAYVIIIIAGGSFRTEVSFNPAKAFADGKQIPFEKKFTSVHFLCGLIQGKQPDLQGTLNSNLKDNDRISEITITTKHTWFDLFLTGITLFIYSPETVIVKGEVSRIE